MPRRRRGTTATLVALVGVLVFAAGGVFAFYAAAQHRPWLVDADRISSWARTTSLGDPVALIVGIAVGVAGLLLLFAAVLPPRRGLVELADDDTRNAVGMRRSSLVRTLHAAATDVDGVTAAKISGRRRITVRATTTLRHTEGLAGQVRQSVERRLTQLRPARETTVRVTLSTKDD